jgi:DNA polymerase II small subunit
MTKQALINELTKKGYLVSPEIIPDLDNILAIDIEPTEKLTMLTKEIFEKSKITWRTNNEKYPVFVKKNYTKTPEKKDFSSFVDYYNKRFSYFENLLKTRNELKNLSSILRAKNSTSQNISIIGMVLEKQKTKNNNIIITLEDQNEKIKVIIGEKNKAVYEKAKDIWLDEVIGITGATGKEVLFVKEIIIPDIPAGEIKKSKEEIYLACIGDIHFGSKLFMKEEFTNLISWFRGEHGTEEQKKLAEKTKYIVLTGDIIEGAGIYPGQEEDLILKDIKDQYNLAHYYLSQIPKDKKIIIFPGNHDVGRLAEPQSAISKKYAENLLSLSNLTSVSNPATVNIAKTEDFEGFDLLLYHGYSFIYYSGLIEHIRAKGGMDRADLIMQFLLKRRHLAPVHESNQFIPDRDFDNLIIDIIPDIFITGHIHKMSVSQYKQTTLVNASCWAKQSEFQEKNGVIPQPAKLPLINLKTRAVKILNFEK